MKIHYFKISSHCRHTAEPHGKWILSHFLITALSTRGPLISQSYFIFHSNFHQQHRSARPTEAWQYITGKLMEWRAGISEEWEVKEREKKSSIFSSVIFHRMTPWGISAKWFNVVVHRTRRLCKRWWPASKWIFFFFRCCCAAVAPVFEVLASIKFSPVRGAALNHGNPQHTLIKNSVLESRFSFSCLHYTHINRPTGGQSTLWVTQSHGGEKCWVDLVKKERKRTHRSSGFCLTGGKYY